MLVVGECVLFAGILTMIKWLMTVKNIVINYYCTAISDNDCNTSLKQHTRIIIVDQIIQLKP